MPISPLVMTIHLTEAEAAVGSIGVRPGFGLRKRWICAMVPVICDQSCESVKNAESSSSERSVR